MLEKSYACFSLTVRKFTKIHITAFNLFSIYEKHFLAYHTFEITSRLLKNDASQYTLTAEVSLKELR